MSLSFLETTWLYMVLNILTLLGPLSRSFESKIQYYKRFSALFSGIFVTGVFFLTWDYFFTEWGVWAFNDSYITGPRLLGMPIEEWLFFLVIPFACIFIYDCFLYFIKKDPLGKFGNYFSLVLIAVLLIVSLSNLDKLYTAFNFLSAAVFLILHLLLFKNQRKRNIFYLAFFVSLIPFFLVNGILTGYATEAPIVSYNDAENLGIRLGTIPIEDSIYGLLLLMMNFTFYEWFQGRFNNIPLS